MGDRTRADLDPRRIRPLRAPGYGSCPADEDLRRGCPAIVAGLHLPRPGEILPTVVAVTIGTLLLALIIAGRLGLAEAPRIRVALDDPRHRLDHRVARREPRVGGVARLGPVAVARRRPGRHCLPGIPGDPAPTGRRRGRGSAAPAMGFRTDRRPRSRRGTTARGDPATVPLMTDGASPDAADATVRIVRIDRGSGATPSTPRPPNGSTTSSSRSTPTPTRGSPSSPATTDAFCAGADLRDLPASRQRPARPDPARAVEAGHRRAIEGWCVAGGRRVGRVVRSPGGR